VNYPQKQEQEGGKQVMKRKVKVNKSKAQVREGDKKENDQQAGEQVFIKDAF